MEKRWSELNRHWICIFKAAIAPEDDKVPLLVFISERYFCDYASCRISLGFNEILNMADGFMNGNCAEKMVVY